MRRRYLLDAVNEAKEDHWTWCGTIKGLGAYPFAAGKVVLDVQERVTKAVNKIEAYMDRIAFGMASSMQTTSTETLCRTRLRRPATSQASAGPTKKPASMSRWPTFSTMPPSSLTQKSTSIPTP